MMKPKRFYDRFLNFLRERTDLKSEIATTRKAIELLEARHERERALWAQQRAELQQELDGFAKYREIEGEYQRACSMHDPIRSPHEGIAIIREEFLEAEKAVFWGGDPRQVDEGLKQLAAMVVRMREDVYNSPLPF